MDWKTILTSSVIAAVISGIFAIVQQKNSTTARYVIEQREEWREKIRDIANEIYNSNEKTIGEILVKLKTRINPYGRSLEFVFINSHNRKKIKRKDKKKLISKENRQEEYYLRDGHIWRVIEKIEKGVDFNQNKNILVDYLSYLIKFDWERAKTESSINKNQIVSIIIEFFAVFLLAFYLSPITKENIIFLVIFVMVYMFSYIMQMSQNSDNNIIKKVVSFAIDKCLIMELIMYGLFIIISVITNHTIICWTCLICIFSEIIKMFSFDSKRKMVADYISALEDLEKNNKKG